LLNKNNFSVITVQKGPHSPSVPHSSHADFRVCIVLEGSAVWEIDNRGYEICSGDIILLNFLQKRHFTSFGEHGFHLCVLSFGRDAFSKLHHFAFFLECVKNHRHVIKNSPSSHILVDIYREMQENHPLRYELASAKLTEFFIKLEKELNYAFRPHSGTDREMLEILDYIDTHITSDISLSKLASKTGLTESSFSRRFSRLNGISFKQYVIAKRIAWAIMLLRTTDMKMVNIALECGFDSISGFYDAFRRQTGTTPSKFSEFEV
ncbi:MAG: helix-turn-helix transcriptional regulator, partial [Clostridia bacterium]|nr:helix-turn-helix transcriptional regulator [Clostridia bacterium]